MLRKINFILLLLVTTSFLFAESTDSIFIKMPQNLLPTLNSKQRFELAEYYKAGSKDSVKNLFGSNCILNVYDTLKCHIIVKTTETTQTEILRFPADNQKNNYLAVINTVTLPVKMSSIRFYTESWLSINKVINAPDFKTWLNIENKDNSEILNNLINSLPYKSYLSYSFSDNYELIIQNNLLSTLTNEEKELIEPYFENKTIKLNIR